MTKGLPRSLSRADQSVNPVLKRSFAISETITITNGGVGWGTAVVGDIPAGVFRLLGAYASFTATKGDADIADAWNGDFSIGTAPATSATLDTTKVNLIPSTATQLAVSGVSSANLGESADAQHNATWLDNSNGTMELNFNIIVDDANISADSSLAVVGRLDIALLYIV